MIYMICNKKTGALMSDYSTITWTDEWPDTIVYTSQDENAIFTRRSSSIYVQIKKLVYNIKHNQDYPYASRSASKTIHDILQEFIGTVGPAKIDYIDSELDDIDIAIYKILQNHIHVKIMDPFTGKFSFLDIDHFLTKKVGKALE